MEIRNEEKEWLEKAKDKGIPKIELWKKLESTNVPMIRIERMLKYYDEITKVEVKKVTEEEKKQEESFEKQVKTYFKDPKELNYLKRKEVKNWIKKLEKQIALLDTLNKSIKEETAEIGKRFSKDSERLDKELLRIKEATVDSILDTKDIFYLEDPDTGEEATKESLMKLDFENITKYIKENKEDLEEVVNGRV